MIARARWIVIALAAWTLSACGTGIDAGGESLGENGGVAFILMTVMLLGTAGILWWILGRDE